MYTNTHYCRAVTAATSVATLRAASPPAQAGRVNAESPAGLLLERESPIW